MHPTLRRASLAVAVAAILAACNTASTPAPSGSAQPRSTPAPTGTAPPSAPGSETASLAPAPTAAAGSTGTGSEGTGPETVRLVLTGGPDAGTYTTDGDPQCSNGLIGENGWGVQYSTADLAGDKDFTSLQLVFYPDGPPGGEATFADTPFLLTVTIGALVEGGRTYEIVDNRVNEQLSKGEGTATVKEGDQAVIGVSGTTDDGVEIDATVTCPSVRRM